MKKREDHSNTINDIKDLLLEAACHEIEADMVHTALLIMKKDSLKKPMDVLNEAFDLHINPDF